MLHAPIDWSEFDRSLAQDTGLSRQLLEVMEQERQALETRRYEQFEQVLGVKQQLILQLEQGAVGRRQWLAARGFADDSGALQQARRDAPAVAERWQLAADHWRECQRVSQINEQICQRTRVVVERILEILRGQPGLGATYDARGVPNHQDSGRTITSA